MKNLSFIVVVLLLIAIGKGSNFKSIEMDIFNKQNWLRQHPDTIIWRIEEERREKITTFTPTKKLLRCVGDKNFDSRLGHKYTDCRGELIPINENSTVPWDSLLEELSYPHGKYSAPTYELKWSDGLAMACRDHVQDIGPCGSRGETGLDGSTLDDWVSRYVSRLDSA